MSETADQDRRKILQEAWERINACIRQGPIQGNGCDAVAQNNGLILASNLIMQMIWANNEPKMRSGIRRLSAQDVINELQAQQDRIKTLEAALQISADRWQDLGQIIKDDGKYDNAGFCFASAMRAKAAIDAALSPEGNDA